MVITSSEKVFQILDDELTDGSGVVDYKWVTINCSVDVNQAKE